MLLLSSENSEIESGACSLEGFVVFCCSCCSIGKYSETVAPNVKYWDKHLISLDMAEVPRAFGLSLGCTLEALSPSESAILAGFE